MQFFKEFDEYKSVASGLRRELKNLGAPPLSHNQILEALAKSFGHKNWAALQVAHRSQPVAVRSFVATYDTEQLDLADDAANASYRLFNRDGSMDLAVDGTLVVGLDFQSLSGTWENILCNTANVDSVSREAGGTLDIGYGGETDVNWDGQEPQLDSRQQTMWYTEGGDSISEDRCCILPEDFNSDNLLDAESVEEAEIAVRPQLVDAAFRWIADHKVVKAALKELHLEEDGQFPDDFESRAWGFWQTKTSGPSTLGKAQQATQFGMHVGEFKLLRERLLAWQQPSLI